MSEPLPMLYKTYYDLSRLVLWADNPDADDNKRASLKLSFRDGNPRFAVSTGVTGRDGMINFPMDIPHFVGIMNLLKDVARGPKGSVVHVDSSGPVYENNKPTSQLEVKAVLHFGKTENGITFISVTADGRPKIIFPFQPSKYHKFRDTQKNDLSAESVSASMAVGIADMYLASIGTILVNYTGEEYTHSQRKPMPIVSPGDKGYAGGQKAKPIANFDDLDSITL